MAIYKTTSSQVIIRKVMRDLKPSGDNWIDDAIEWIGEALEHIGASTQLETKQCVLTISEFKAVLPSDLYYVNQVSTSSMTNAGINSALNNVKAQVQALSDILAANPNQDCDKCVNETATGSEWYVIENGYVKTSFQTGEICIAYKAFPTDDDCYPLVPDDISYKEAMFWYIYKKLLLGGYDKPSNKIDYVFAEQMWLKYCTQARNAANFPDIDRYTSFMNQWVRLIPSLNHHETDFGNLGERENLNRG